MYMEGMTGLGKSAGETLFDTGRARLWTEFVAIVDPMTRAIQAGQVTPSQVANGIAGVLSIITRHKALYAQALAAGAAASWLDPRFNDYEKPFEAKLSELQAMQVPNTTGAPVVTMPTDMTTPTQLIISGAAAGAQGPAVGAAAPSSRGGGGVFADLFGPPAPTAVAAPTDMLSQIGPYVPLIAAGLAVAYFLRRK